MVDVKEIAEKIYLIDDQLYSIPKWGSVYLIDEVKKALIDTGPTTSANTVLEGLKQVGVRPEDMDYLIVTHVHLDHAGGAGFLLKGMPQAQVVVHHKGAKYLVNPEKLVGSVIATQGEEAMAKLGEVVPLKSEQIKPVSENDELRLSENQVLKFIDAPGHAPHELCIYESRNNGLFSGDAIGISVAENKVLLPLTTPPSFDLALYLDTLERLIVLQVKIIYFAHFGASNKALGNLQQARDRLQVWAEICAKAAETGFDSAVKKLKTQMYTELEPVRRMESLHKYLTEEVVPLNVAGYLKYYQGKYKL